MLPTNVEYIEAFADKQNINSQNLMKKLGMIFTDSSYEFVHLRGEAEQIINRFI